MSLFYTFLDLHNLSTVDEMASPKVSLIQRFYCTSHLPILALHSDSEVNVELMETPHKSH